MSAYPNPGQVRCAFKVRIHRFEEPGEHSVRFLGPVETMHAHWPRTKGRAIACIGAGCPADVHKLRLAFQAYLPAEIWRIAAQAWEPVVAQITPGWFEMLRDKNPRGQSWLAQRCQNEFGKSEIVAHLVDHVDVSKLRTDINVRQSVAICYSEPNIAWGRPPILTQRQILFASEGDAPPTAEPPKPRDQIEGTEEYLARLKREQKEIKEAGGFLKFVAKKQKELNP